MKVTRDSKHLSSGKGSGKLPKNTVKDYPPSKRHRFRMRLVLWCFLLGMCGVIARLVVLHVSPNWDLGEDDVHHIGEVVIQVPRGDILDREGRLLATDQDVRSLCADPSQMENPVAVAAALAQRLGLDEEQLYHKMVDKQANGNPRRFIWVKRWLEPSDLQRLGDIEAISKALRFETEPLRFYPQASLGAHVLGFANKARAGCAGVELAFNDRLRSTPGKLRGWKDGNRVLLPSLTMDYEAPSGGDDIELTLDADIQHSLEMELDLVLERCNASRAMGIMLNPKTGAIYAMAIRPAYDPNRYWESPEEMRANRAALDVFEPGSAFKLVTATAALEEGIIRPDDEIDCEQGRFRPYGRRIITDTHEMGVASFRECFAQSSNIAMVKLASKLTPEGMDEWIRKFGFGETTGSDFRLESAGLYRPVPEWSGASLVSLSFGQEIAVTMLQLARAYCVIANGGYLIQPHVVARAVDQNGQNTYEANPGEPRRILHEETARIMRELCHEVVTHGTATYANIPEFRAGGKTGTAQIAKPDGSGYYKDRYTTVFAGFAPVSDPQICSVIVVHAPMIRQHYGGYVCGPVFKKVVRDALIRMHCPEDPVQVDVDAPATHEDPDLIIARDDPMDMTLDELLAPLDEPELASMELVEVEQDPANDVPRLPDLRGMTKNQATLKLAELQLDWAARGSGWVSQQDPPPGTPLSKVSLCRLVFSNERSAFRESGGHDATRASTTSRM